MRLQSDKPEYVRKGEEGVSLDTAKGFRWPDFNILPMIYFYGSPHLLNFLLVLSSLLHNFYPREVHTYTAAERTMW